MPRSIEAKIFVPIKPGGAPDVSSRIDHRPLSALRTNPRNARTHSKKQVGQIADSIRRFGFTNPVLIDAEDTILAGHGRVAAAKLLGLESVPTVCLDHLNEAERRAYVIADNKLAELAGWDDALLAIEFQELSDLDFDLSLTGFSTGEIDFILDDQAASDREAEDEILEPEPGPAVSLPGDLWLLGEHRLYCGSSLEASSYEALMGDERARMVFTDPPFNVPIKGHVSGLGKKQHREFAMASGEMDRASFTEFLRTAFTHMATFSADGSIHQVCMDWRHMREILDAAEGLFELKNLCVWNKDNAGMGSLYRSKHELVFVFKKGGAAHVNNVELGRHGRNRSNVWDYPGQNTFHRNRTDDLAAHPTVKPVALVADAIRDVTERGTIVLDPFNGSGTTILAAEKTGRRARTIELDPAYVDVAIRRWEAMTGGSACHAETGQTLAETQATRANTEIDHAA
jgi:DNA modification methylase